MMLDWNVYRWAALTRWGYTACLAMKDPDSETIDLPLRAETAERPERRRHPRRGTSDLQLVQPVLGQVVDISAGGIGVLTRDALPVHKESYFCFGPPGQRARVRARVIWCRLRASEPGVDWTIEYWAGIQFL